MLAAQPSVHAAPSASAIRPLVYPMESAVRQTSAASSAKRTAHAPTASATRPLASPGVSAALITHAAELKVPRAASETELHR